MSKRTQHKSSLTRRKSQSITPEEAKIWYLRAMEKKANKDARLMARLFKKSQSKRVIKPKRRADLRPSKRPKVEIVSIGGVPVEGNEDG